MDEEERSEPAARAAAERRAYDELSCYALAHGGRSFLHQHVVDAWAAQQAHAESAPIGVAFALIGLCLHVERGFSGRNVQRVHMDLARRSRSWPRFELPRERGRITAAEVMRSPAGPQRDQAIEAWCACVWEAWRDAHAAVRELLARHGLV